MLHFRAYLRTQRKKSTIYFVVDPGDVWLSLRLKCSPQHWDAATGTIKRSHPEYGQLMPLFELYRSRAQQCLSNWNIEGKPFNKKIFSSYLAGPEDAANPSIIKLIDDYTGSTAMGLARTKHYWYLKNDIKALAGACKLRDINFHFVKRLRQYLVQKGNCENTITRKLKQLKAVIHDAQLCGLITGDPLAGVRLKEIKGTKVYLQPAELAALEQLHRERKLQGITQDVLTFFLFSCYTGIRYSDICQLQRTNISADRITLVQEKTNKPVVIPLIPKAGALLPPAGPLFNLHPNQVCNRELKKIAMVAGIDNLVTYHVSRHTFATLSIYWGIPYEIVADIMGIDLKTARVYVKIMDAVKFEQMKKWGAGVQVAS